MVQRLGVVLLVAFASQPLAHVLDELVPAGATWSYLDDGSDQGTAWSASAFDDSGWAAGPAKLGYGDGDESTMVGYGPSSSSKYVTTYFRHAFSVTNPASYSNLVLFLQRDDGAVIHLNGVEVARSNMSAGAIDFGTLADSTHSAAEEEVFVPITLSPASLVSGTNVFAIEIHQRDYDSSDISLDARLVASDRPIIVRGPYLQRATPASITVRWRTDVAVDGRVHYGSAPGSLSSSTDDPSVSVDHEVVLTGLAADTTYHYAVATTSATLVGDDAQHRFTTHPLAGADRPFRAWIIGDSGTANANADSVRDAYDAFAAGAPTDVWLMLGDNAYNDGSDEQYQAGVFQTYPARLIDTPLWPTRGNHEKSSSTYYDIFTLPSAGEAGGQPSGTEAYYSFDYANVHFVCLDSEGSDRTTLGAMYAWLALDLASTSQDWVIAFWHHPPYTRGSHDSDVETHLIDMRQNFLPLLESYGVDLVFCGHSHSYERSFLVDGHYGLISSFVSTMKQDPGDGDPAGDGAYQKAPIANAGAVYVVAGSSGKLTTGPLDHPVMLTSTVTLGSVVLDVTAHTLTARFLDSVGGVLDTFSMVTFPDAGLSADVTSASAVYGDTQSFSLDGGGGLAGAPYFLAGSFAGTLPGTPLGAVTVPLNVDSFLLYGVANANLPPYTSNFGLLDGSGKGTAALTVPPIVLLPLFGTTLHHAFVAFDPGGSGAAVFASNALPLTLGF